MIARRGSARVLLLAAATTILLSGVGTEVGAAGATVSAVMVTGLRSEGREVVVSGAALLGLGAFDATPPGTATPSASATARRPYREVTVSETPYGDVNAEDPALGVAYAGGGAPARARLQVFRATQGARLLATPSADLFGSTVSGAANLVDLTVDGPHPAPTVVAEWVVEHAGAIWLVRTAEQVTSGAGTSTAAGLLDRLAGISVTTASGSGVATSVAEPTPSSSPTATAGSTPPGVPPPSWWSGVCDTTTYAAAAMSLVGHAVAAYPLGASWDGLVACGPRPGYNEGPDVSVTFPGAAWSELEWECVELSMRWMYLAWGVEPYPANGSGVVWNYAATQAQFNPHGPHLVAIVNDGQGQLPVPGDVLSFGATSTAGHTAVVASVDVDAGGNGDVTVIEENASPTGWDTVPVSAWVLGGFDGGVTGWLHDPSLGRSRAPEPVVLPDHPKPEPVVLP